MQAVEILQNFIKFHEDLLSPIKQRKKIIEILELF